MLLGKGKSPCRVPRHKLNTCNVMASSRVRESDQCAVRNCFHSFIFLVNSFVVSDHKQLAEVFFLQTHSELPDVRNPHSSVAGARQAFSKADFRKLFFLTPHGMQGPTITYLCCRLATELVDKQTHDAIYKDMFSLGGSTHTTGDTTSKVKVWEYGGNIDEPPCISSSTWTSLRSMVHRSPHSQLLLTSDTGRSKLPFRLGNTDSIKTITT